MSASGAVLEFEDYVRARQDALLRSARRLVPDPIDAQDLVQTALVRTYPRWSGIADKTLADAYLRRVMINTRTEWWRSRRLDEVPTGEVPDATVDDGTEQRALRAMLRDVMRVLAPKQRQVVMMRHYGQLSTEETARALGMSPGTVKSTLHRALARMRHELEHGRYGYTCPRTTEPPRQPGALGKPADPGHPGHPERPRNPGHASHPGHPAHPARPARTAKEVACAA